jgi:hypothetical protein
MHHHRKQREMKTMRSVLLLCVCLILPAYGDMQARLLLNIDDTAAVVDHITDNEKLAKDIQKAIDGLDPLKDAGKIETLKKVKKHIEDNKEVDPVKNLDDAVKTVVKKGDRNDWLDNLVRGW